MPEKLRSQCSSYSDGWEVAAELAAPSTLSVEVDGASSPVQILSNCTKGLCTGAWTKK